MIIEYTTFQAAQLLKKFGFKITFDVAEELGDIIKECGIEDVEARMKAKRQKNDESKRSR